MEREEIRRQAQADQDAAEAQIVAAMELIGCTDREEFMRGLAIYEENFAGCIDENEVDRLRNG